jgi:hypothetical protein
VTVYAIAPPTSAERLLKIESRLKDKLRVAQRTIGVAGRILPSPLALIPPAGLAEQRSEIESRLRTWRDARAPLIGEPLAAVACDATGFIALVRTSRGAELIADVGNGIDTSTDVVVRALSFCTGPSATVDRTRAGEARASIEDWLAARRGADTVDLTAATAARSRRAALNRVALAIARAPRHHRLRLAPLADAARSVAFAPLAEGAERALDTLIRADLPDEAWLRSIAAFGELNARAVSLAAPPVGIIAVILFLPGRNFSLGQTDRE